MIYKPFVDNEKVNAESEAEQIYYNLLRDIANFTIKYRKANGVTNKQLADELGITTSLVSRIESGNKNVSIKTLSKLLAKTNARIEIKENKSY